MSRTVSILCILYTDGSGNHCASVLCSTVLEDGVWVGRMNVRRTILLSNNICLEHRSYKSVLSFVRNLYAVEPVTLRPAAILLFVMFAIFRIILAHVSQVNIFNASAFAGYIISLHSRERFLYI